MFGFFNTKDTYKGALQVTNTVAFVYAAYDFYTNPTTEALPGMAQYILNVVSLAEKSDSFWKLTGLVSNIFRLGALYGDPESSLISYQSLNYIFTIAKQLEDDEKVPASNLKAK